MSHPAAVLSLVLVALPLAAAEAPPAGPTMAQVIEQSKASDWRPLEPENTLYLELDAGRVVIELAPQFAPRHVANIRTLARGGYWDGLAILRSQETYVVQWGDPQGEDEAKRRPLGDAEAKLPAELVRPAAGVAFTRSEDGDVIAPEVGWSGGFPVGRDPQKGEAWLVHCYAAVGAGRDVAPDSSNGAELYAVIGHSPRHLDRNITVVGRVVQGMELLSVLPRGTGALGFYESDEQRVPIRAVRLAAAVPAAERTPLEIFRTDTPAFKQLVEARRNRLEEWFHEPLGAIDLCNVPIPTRIPPTR
jgi:peptidylprolyl isomerase